MSAEILRSRNLPYGDAVDAAGNIVIISTLADHGYVEQEAPRKDYTLGPAPYGLTRNGPYRKDLVLAGHPVISAPGSEVNETVLLVVLSGTQRVVLCRCEGSSHLNGPTPT